MEEVKYTSEFDGQTTDEILKHAKSVKDLTIPSLSNISGFVCIDNEGKAIGMMSKEDIAQVVGELLPITSQKNDGSEGKKLLIDLPSDVVKRITVLLTIEGVANTIALFLIHVITSSPVYYSVEKLNSDTAISSSAKFYIDKSSGVKLYGERDGCVFNVTVLQGSINYVPLTNVETIPSSAESVSIIQ